MPVLAWLLNNMYDIMHPDRVLVGSVFFLLTILVTIVLLTLLLMHSCFCCWVATNHERHTSCITANCHRGSYCTLECSPFVGMPILGVLSCESCRTRCDAFLCNKQLKYLASDWKWHFWHKQVVLKCSAAKASSVSSLYIMLPIQAIASLQAMCP